MLYLRILEVIPLNSVLWNCLGSHITVKKVRKLVKALRCYTISFVSTDEFLENILFSEYLSIWYVTFCF